MQNNWIKEKQNVIITGPSGSGKTFIACALANRQDAPKENPCPVQKYP